VFSVAVFYTGLAVKPGGDLVYVACEDGVSVIRTADYSIAAVIPLNGAPSDILFSATGETAYVTCPSSDSVVVLDTRDNNRIGQAAFGGLGLTSPKCPTTSSDGRSIYLIGGGDNFVGIVRRSDNYLIRLVRVGSISRPAEASVAIEHPTGNRAYVVTNRGVLVLRPSSLR